jgi:hypothetical protein
MELENLKTIWKDVGTKTATTSAEELEQMLSKKSKSPIAKLKRNLFWEMIVVVVMYGSVIIYYLFKNEPGMLYLAILMASLGALYAWYYVTKRRILTNMECITCEVKSNLSTQLTALEKLVKLYVWAGTLLVPVILLFAFVIVLFFGENDEAVKQLQGKLMYLFVGWVVISLVITIPLFFLNKWYVNLLYGRHVKKLRKIVNEMNELPFHVS